MIRVVVELLRAESSVHVKLLKLMNLLETHSGGITTGRL